MKKLNAEEAKHLTGRPAGRETNLSLWIKSLAVGEALLIDAKEWSGRHSPYERINYIARTTGRRFAKGKQPDGKGWWVKRVE